MSENIDKALESNGSFYRRPNVQNETIPIGGGVPFGMESVTNAELGIGGAYGAWGASIDNAALPGLIEHWLGERLDETERMDLSQLGFLGRHHTPELSTEDHLELELQVGERLLRQAARANGWEPAQVEAVLIGMSGPIADDYVEQIARRAGIPESALKVSVHKACDGSVGGLNLALNPGLARPQQRNIAEELHGRRTLVGGIEGLSRFIRKCRDKNALQLFGNGAGVIGVIPGETMKFLTGKDHEVFDKDGVLAVHMYYPHSRERAPGKPLVEVSQSGPAHIRVAGLMHEPKDGAPIAMAGLMGMVKLFVRSGVQVVTDVHLAYRQMMEKLDMPDKSLVTSIVHHANYKINQLKAKHLQNLGIHIPMPWLLSDFGNVSAASNMIAFLRQLPKLKPGDHILFDGFGAGTYYDVLAVSLG
ncbi:MAG: 3-oxoacyl-[acyl-carrier-protein] synthase III C-terminal domain-containing protein [Chloroflexota bacterium]